MQWLCSKLTPHPFISTPSPPTHLTLGCHISGRTEPPALAPQRVSLQQLDSLLETLLLSVHGEGREKGRGGKRGGEGGEEGRRAGVQGEHMAWVDNTCRNHSSTKGTAGELAISG